MSIRDWGEKIKWQGGELLTKLRGGGSASKYYTATVVILVGLSSFGLGRLSVLEDSREPITIEQDGAVSSIILAPIANTQGASVAPSISTSKVAQQASGQIVASKNGTKYYFPWCSSNIAERNKVWFNSEADARAKGYQPASNCKGLSK